MSIMCSGNIYQKIVVLLYLCGNRDTLFSGLFDEIKKQHLFEIQIFCNIINAFTVIFYQFNNNNNKNLTNPKLVEIQDS